MIALYIIGCFLAFILITAAIIGTAWNYEKSILIDAPPEKVWGNVNTLRALTTWNPWMARDENITTQFTGTDGTPGAQFSWDSELKNVGAGRQTIISVTGNNPGNNPASATSGNPISSGNPGNSVNSGSLGMITRIEFLRPFNGKGDAFVYVIPANGSTKVSWRIECSTPYPMNIVKLFGVIEKNMNKDFTGGLDKLKMICEQ